VTDAAASKAGASDREPSGAAVAAVGTSLPTIHRVLLGAFGAGFTWGACVIEWGAS
jgi:hypothetical protein